MKKVGSYGSGFLSRISRASGDVIAYRWHEQNRGHKRILGPVSKFRAEALAWKEVERLGLRRKGDLRTVNDLIHHWQEKEASRRASSTWDTYQGYIRKWIAPTWGSRRFRISTFRPSSVNSTVSINWLIRNTAPASLKQVVAFEGVGHGRHIKPRSQGP